MTDDPWANDPNTPPPTSVSAGVTPRERAQQLPSGAYRKQVKDPLNPGRNISITCPTEGEVLRKVDIVRGWRRDLQFGLVTREEIAQRIRLITGETKIVPLILSEIWEAYVASFSPARQRALAGAWALHFRRFDRRTVLEITVDDWKAWEQDEAKISSKGYIKTLFAQMRSAVNRVRHAGKLASYPWELWHPSGKFGKDVQRREPLRSIEEIERLLRAAREHDERLRSHGYYSDALAKVATLFFLGLRQSEGAALGWDHVRTIETREGPEMVVEIEFASHDGWRDDNRDKGWTRPMDPPKRNSKRTLRVHPTHQAILREHRAYLEAWGLYRKDGPVFPVPPTRGRSADASAQWRNDEWILKPSSLRDMARAAGLEIDVARFDCHALRHSFVTLELAATNNPIATAQRSGHKDLRVFFQYAHQVGRGLPESPLRALRLQPPSVAYYVPPAELPALPAAADVESVTTERAAEIRELRAGAEDILTIVGPADDAEIFESRLSMFERAFQRWTAAGRPTRYPREVAERMNQAYSRAYNAAIRTKRRGETNEERKKRAQEAGFRSKRAVQGAWGKLLRRIGEEPDPVQEPTEHEAIEGEIPEFDAAEEQEAPRLAAAGGGGAVVIPFRRRAKGAL